MFEQILPIALTLLTLLSTGYKLFQARKPDQFLFNSLLRHIPNTMRRIEYQSKIAATAFAFKRLIDIDLNDRELDRIDLLRDVLSALAKETNHVDYIKIKEAMRHD